MGGGVATGPWDPTRADTPGHHRFLASDADRERAIDVLKTAFVQGALTKDQLAVRTGQALRARTYGHLAALTADLAARPAGAAKPAKPAKPAEPAKPATAKTAKATPAPARKRLTRKAVAWGACAIVLPTAVVTAFLNYYGGFLIMMLLTFLGTVLCSKPPAPRRPGPPR
jgi:hypothetical protein